MRRQWEGDLDGQFLSAGTVRNLRSSGGYESRASIAGARYRSVDSGVGYASCHRGRGVSNLQFAFFNFQFSMRPGARAHNPILQIEKCKLQIELKSDHIKEDCMTRTIVCCAVFLLSLT